MSKDTKFFAKPKVRFTPIDAGKSITKDLQNSTGSQSVKQSNKPTIQSVIILDEPVKLVKLNEINGDNKNFNNVRETVSSIDAVPFSTIQILNKNFVETKTPLNDADNIQNIKANLEDDINTSKTCIRSSNDNIVSINEQSKNLCKLLELEDPVKPNSLKKDKKGKENEVAVLKKNTKEAIIKSLDLDILKHKARLCSTSKKKPNKTVILNTTKNRINSKPVVDVMPCYKYNKVASKVKTPAVKKTVIRDIIGPKTKACVNSGVLHMKLSDLEVPEINVSSRLKPTVSGDKLARPEYNSIVCTIDKLNEMKKQEIVPNAKNLPASYKSLINEKISTALDFPLDEAIYKNLVDLSIDENQLPSRLTRSKDPEPRQKDAVPILSNFFTPVPSEEYCTAVSIIPRTPEIADSWDAFRISDQMCEWKYFLDSV